MAVLHQFNQELEPINLFKFLEKLGLSIQKEVKMVIRSK